MPSRGRYSVQGQSSTYSSLRRRREDKRRKRESRAAASQTATQSGASTSTGLTQEAVAAQAGRLQATTAPKIRRVHVILHKITRCARAITPMKSVYVVLERLRVNGQERVYVTASQLREAIRRITDLNVRAPVATAPAVGQVEFTVPQPPVARTQGTQQRRHGEDAPIPRRRNAEISLCVTYRQAILQNAEAETRVRAYDIGLMNVQCPDCGALFFERESPHLRVDLFERCCSRGDIVLPQLGECPAVLRELLTARSTDANEFRRNIRSANSLFAMATFKTTIPEDRNVGQGAWCFHICGQIYHHTNRPPITTQEREEPTLNQYYFVDAEEAIERRAIFIADRIRRGTIERLERMLRETNELVRGWMSVGEVIEHMRRTGEGEVENIIIGFKQRIGEHLRTHNLPESRSDIAAVFAGVDPPFSLDFAVYPREDQGRCQLKNLNKMTDPMVYPLLFPHGEPGYDYKIPRRRRPDRTVSFNKFYRYRIQTRPGFSIIHNGGKLFQQYLVDAYVKVEANRLWYLRQTNIQTRFAQYTHVASMLEARARGEGMRVGKVVILPATFYGSRRGMNRLYLDAMTIVARHGKPDLFITMTCNPHWPEITDNLEHGQSYMNRPDLVCRVFAAKLNEFIDDIAHKQLYGVILNYMYVIEIQKRGLPHAHILVTLMPDEKYDTPEDIDSVIAATIPDERTEPTLYAIVRDCHIHRVCGERNPDAPCTSEGRCTKGFPKRNRETTTLAGNMPSRQPEYRRPLDGRTVQVGGIVYDNTHIVPYNRYAAMKYRCHINFEFCGSAATVKYLHKYVHKGPDCITVQTKDARSEMQWDEIRSHLECRYVSATEAVWRLLEFPMHGRSHSVLCLPVHLQEERTVIFDENEPEEDVARAALKPTKLEAWFTLNRHDAAAGRFKYAEIPEHYVWDGGSGTWNARRQISKQLGSLVEISPNNVELFHLRILLQHVRGATSYEELRTAEDGTVWPDFVTACRERNLLDTCDEYDRCLAEAAAKSHPSRLRRLFALLCILCLDEHITQARELWELHSEHLTEDLRRGLTGEEGARAAELQALRAIQRYLEGERQGLLLTDVGLPSLREYDDVADEADELIAGAEHDAEPFNVGDIMEGLNDDQAAVFLAVVAALRDYLAERQVVTPPGVMEAVLGYGNAEAGARSSRGRAFYVDGPGGTGKTFLYNRLLQFVRRGLGLTATAVAWTGIAATLLKGGRTCHSTFRLPIDITDTTVAGHPLGSRNADAIRDATIIIWDEAPMTPRRALRAVDIYLRDVMNRPEIPFGGKVVLLGGDFRQVLPVVVGGHSAEIVGASIRASFLWTHMRKYKLTRNMRAAARGGGEHSDYAEYLLMMGEARLTRVRLASAPHASRDLIEIPNRMLVATAEELFHFVYPDGVGAQTLANRAILCPTNASADDINRRVLETLDAPEKIYVSVDAYTGGEEDEFHVNADVLNSISGASLPPHELILKVGATVMLLRNLSIGEGQCNGVRLRVVSMGEHLIEVETLTGDNRGKVFWLPKVKMTAKDPALPKPMTRTQFPIKLAYAMTINKAQGQTFDRVGVYLDKPCFSHGQLYVACSRVGTYNDIRLYVRNTTRQGSFKCRTFRRFTRNVVYNAVVGTEGTFSLVDIEDGPPDMGEMYERDRGRARQYTVTTGQSSRIETGIAWGRRDEYDAYMETVPDEAFLKIAATKELAGRAEEERYMFRTTQDLRERVAVDDRPGTTGLYLQKIQRSPPRQSDTDSD